ncbi:MAG: ABC transporter ATP-binding protein [Desulfurococcaceae archaeon]
MVLAIRAENLKVGYASEEGYVIWATRGVNLEVSEGEALCLVGESGCGKSTIASAIAGVLPPHSITEGRLWIFDRLVIDGPRHRFNGVRGRTVSLIPQNPGTSLNPFITVEDHFYYIVRELHKLNREGARKTALEHLRMVGLNSDVLDKYPHQLSGGMQQRVLIAIALASGARIVVADEPTSSVDANLRAQILALINKLRKELKLTLLLITHDMLSTASVCDKIAVMYAGKIVEVGSTQAVLNKPYHPYTRMLLESIPVLGSKKPLKPLPGEPPSLLEDFSRCPFRDRCPFRADVCEKEPPLVPVNGTGKPHYTMCWRFKEVIEHG